MLSKKLFFACWMVFCVSPIFADIDLPSTGEGAPANGQGNGSIYDSAWSAGFIGSFEVGTEINNGTGHNGTQLGQRFSADGDGYKKGQVFTVDTLVKAVPDNMNKAFVYDGNSWPANVLGGDLGSAGWIGDAGTMTQSGDLLSHDAGYYAYQLDFEITDADDVGSYLLTGNFLVDNLLMGIMIDDQLIYSSIASDTTKSGLFENLLGIVEFDLDLGEHTLTILTSNFGNATNYGNPAGLYADGVTLVQTSGGNTATPEPSTCLIFSLGAIGAGFMARRRMKKQAA